MVTGPHISIEVFRVSAPIVSSDLTFRCLVPLSGHGNLSLAYLWSCLLRHTTLLLSLGSSHLFLFLGILLSFSFFLLPTLKNLFLVLKEIHFCSYLCLFNALLLGFWELKLGSWKTHSCLSLRH